MVAVMKHREIKRVWQPLLTHPWYLPHAGALAPRGLAWAFLPMIPILLPSLDAPMASRRFTGHEMLVKRHLCRKDRAARSVAGAPANPRAHRWQLLPGHPSSSITDAVASARPHRSMQPCTMAGHIRVLCLLLNSKQSLRVTALATR